MRADTRVLWVVEPVVVKEIGRDEYGVPATSPYLHVAALSVPRDRVVCVVPAGRADEGEPFEGTGGVDDVGGVDWVEARAGDDLPLSFPAAS